SLFLTSVGMPIFIASPSHRAGAGAPEPSAERIAGDSFRAGKPRRSCTTPPGHPRISRMDEAPHASAAKDLRRRDPAVLDALDERIVEILSRDGRVTNADLAAALDIAPSTAHARMRS